MVFIHPIGPVLTHFFGSVLTHPTGGIDIRTCIQPEIERKEHTIGPVHTHTQNLKPSASLFRGSKGGEGNYSNSGHGREGMGRDGHDIGWEGAIR